MFKLLALDMDGTLLKNDGTISTLTKKSLLEAKNKDVKIVIATGRPIEGVMSYLNELNLIGDEEYVLAYNGSVVYNTKTLTPLIKNGITGKDTKDIYHLSEKLGVGFHGFTEEGCIAPKKNIYTDGEELHNKVKILITNFDNDIKDTDFIIKVMMVDEPSKLDSIIKSIPSEFYKRFNIVRSTTFMLEFMNKDCNKTAGLKALSNHLNINNSEIIAFGDAENDIDMIEYAGLGVAMYNASDLVKSKADFITCSNENDGIKKVIDIYI